MEIQKMVDALCTLGRRKTDPDMALASLLYYGAVLMNRYDLSKDIKNLNKFINIYVLMFAGSGAGKGFVIRQTEKLAQVQNYPEQMKIMYEHFISLEPDGVVDPEVLRFIPSNVNVALDGSKEGLFDICNAVKESNFGSVNMMMEEFGDVITSSQEMIAKLKELYDNRYPAKVKRGQKGDAKEYDIEDIVVNLMAMSSLDGLDVDSRKVLSSSARSGLYRRSLVINSTQGAEKNEVQDQDLESIEQHFKQIDNKWKASYKKRLDLYSQTGTLREKFPITEEAQDYIEKLDDMILTRHQEDKLNVFKSYDTGTLNQIVNIGYIVSFLEGNERVEVEHLKYAWTIFHRTRENTYSIFKDKKAHEEIYELLKMKDNLTQSDLLELDRADCIPKTKSGFSDAMLLVQELAYSKGEELYIGHGIVVRFSIRDLPKTNLDKLILSIERDGMREKAICFEPIELPWSRIESLAKSYRREILDQETGEVEITGTESFTMAHYESSPRTEPMGHRHKDRFSQGQNMIAFDIDGTDTIENMKITMEQYTYCIYTTKSHLTEKRDYNESFRVLVPTKHMFYVNPEQHKDMYKNIVEYLRIDGDLSTYNVSRIWYSNENAETFTNDAELFDVAPFMPDTEKNKDILPSLMSNRIVNQVYDEKDETERRIAGMIDFCVLTIEKGNLKNKLYNLWMLVMDLTNDRTQAENALNEVQQKRGFPHKFVQEFVSSH